MKFTPKQLKRLEKEAIRIVEYKLVDKLGDPDKTEIKYDGYTFIKSMTCAVCIPKGQRITDSQIEEILKKFEVGLPKEEPPRNTGKKLKIAK